MNAALYIGLCDTSHNNGLSSAATFSQISINGSATPTAPSGLAASAPNGTSVSLAWTNIDNFRFGNQVYRQNPNSTTYSWVATLPSNATSYLDTGLTPGAAYSYQILTTNTVGNSAASNAAAIATPIAPLAVSQLQPSSIATTSAALNWILNSANNTGVQIMRRAGGVGGFALVATLSGSPTTYTDTGLQSGVLYEYRVSATNSAGLSPAADTGLTTLPLPPIAGATANAGQIQLNWTAANGAVAYNIYRGLTPSSEGASPYASVNGAVGFTDAGITTAHAYYYRITAVDFSGESAPSAEVSAAIAQTLTSVSNNPTSVTLAAGASQQFTGAANDQFGSPLSVQPALTWTLIGGGSLSNSGLYTPPYANGSASVRVANGSLLGTASVTFTGQAQWNSGSDGTWTTNGNWKDTSSGATIAAPGLRGVIGDTILLGQATARTIRLDGTNPTIAAMLIDSSSSYTVSQGSGGSLHLANGGSGASIVVSSGSHTIGAPIALDGSVAIGPILGSSLTVSGPISGVGSSVTLADRGTLILAGVNTFGGGTIINSGKLIVSASTALPTGSALAIGPGGTLIFDPLPVTAATASAIARAADSVFGGW